MSALLSDHEDVAGASEVSHSNESARAPFISFSNRSGDDGRLHRPLAIRRKRPALVRMRPVHRPPSGEGAVNFARYAESIGHAL
ncbi:hypothetical protein FIBSPDRAFT_880282 [Athelia psychrophila]|uniref:Uncharacterized protein n=1 Tax=Athelia psychrophila TaxID=1759441 RepID=A0A167T340_9AGAM|nr:hypothetical protein FIBSPDRAFT_880282 [Fibularhizoctonia sp. CBS 109695]